ncbi:hypothetical protein P3538_23180 [Vibrio parahaemolyticus]|uniref:hypothetical protein n=1 Tax=Vibrio parahaemolyticus TaxID=670 RepID=UPI00112216F2|nr:hypothetical protein [Vibrio parahaemolyticus]MDF4677391.1 hypothetical protein [Vibrio parahaemolyticus]MDF4701529.1 hypothetical protein [Vibrio parahaemolyticus]TON06800.1 hypothetical protein CGH63_24400 [Vibrio parahaemolyticus]TOO27657.1 hypothetical protein CGH39_25085 [Vibrio parahaemolyticus]TOP23686.1 hypothetical protein CGH20_23465 [Vibrio parahaemolyticus]
MLKVVIKIGVVIVFFISALYGFLYFNSNELKKYCSDEIVGHSYDQVNSYVLDRQLYLHRELSDSTGKAVINNHASPFFRMACFIELESGVVKVAQYGAGD